MNRPLWGRFALLLIAALAVALPACSRSSSPDPVVSNSGGNFDRNAMLLNLAQNVVLPSYRQFEVQAQDLVTQTQEWADAIRNAGNVSQELSEAQQAWRSSMDLWQELELYQFGPEGPATQVVGGQDLREEIYSFPITNTCRVDQETVENNFPNANFTDNELTNVYGFDALEYLLFNASTQNNCPPQADINSNGSWDALVNSGDLDQRRADYAVVVAQDILANATALKNAWEAGQGDFSAQFSLAGLNGSVYPSAQAAANDVFAGMFYLDLLTKDVKLGRPAGVIGATTVDPSQVESFYARRSKEHVLANLRAFRKLYLGNDPADPARPGFDDWLVAVGANQLAMDLQTAIDDAISAVQNIPGTLHDAVTNDLASVQSAIDAIRVITNFLKAQFPSVLNLSVPNQGAGDND